VVINSFLAGWVIPITIANPTYIKNITGYIKNITGKAAPGLA
jgi:hypothetical protein